MLRVSEWTESLRDMITTVFETNLSLQDARLNTVMKKLTGWAAIIAVPTAITGFRPERGLSGHRHGRRVRREHHDHRAAGGNPVLNVSPAGLALAAESQPVRGSNLGSRPSGAVRSYPVDSPANGNVAVAIRFPAETVRRKPTIDGCANLTEGPALSAGARGAS